jgi:uncharacterized membrane protein HdeD (DUF308 family)
MTPSGRRRTLAGMSVDMSPSPVAQIARNWWLFLILGLVSVIAGILAIVYPDITLLALGLFIGISLLFIGAMDVVDAIAGSPDSRALSAIVGVLSLLAGLVCLRRPGESLLALVVVLGIYLVITGVIRFVRAFSELEDRALLLGLAILDVILGILILSLPKLSLVTLAVLFAISLLARGVFAIFAAFRLRSLRHSEPGTTAAA